MVASVFLSMLAGYSVTLLFPVVGALALWVVLGRVRKPLAATCYLGGIGLCFFAAFVAIGLFSEPQGRIAVAFDGGQLLQNVLISYSPVILAAALSWRQRRELTLNMVTAMVCILWPSFIFSEQAGIARNTFSMKLGTLLSVALVPHVGRGIRVVYQQPRHWTTYLVAVAALLGTVNTGAYILRIPANRYFGFEAKHYDSAHDYKIDRGYFELLNFVRLRTPQNALVLDVGSLERDQVLNTTLMIGERRTFVPDLLASLKVVPLPIQPRLVKWRAWRATHYSNDELARYFADSADYLIVGSNLRPPKHWKLERRFGGYCLYQSALR